MKVILDATDIQDLKTLVWEFNKHCVRGNHQCPKVIWVTSAVMEELKGVWKEQHPGKPFKKLFKKIPVETVLWGAQ